MERYLLKRTIFSATNSGRLASIIEHVIIIPLSLLAGLYCISQCKGFLPLADPWWMPLYYFFLFALCGFLMWKDGAKSFLFCIFFKPTKAQEAKYRNQIIERMIKLN